jgi:hypothetical protein
MGRETIPKATAVPQAAWHGTCFAKQLPCHKLLGMGHAWTIVKKFGKGLAGAWQAVIFGHEGKSKNLKGRDSALGH